MPSKPVQPGWLLQWPNSPGTTSCRLDSLCVTTWGNSFQKHLYLKDTRSCKSQMILWSKITSIHFFCQQNRGSFCLLLITATTEKTPQTINSKYHTNGPYSVSKILSSFPLELCQSSFHNFPCVLHHLISSHNSTLSSEDTMASLVQSIKILSQSSQKLHGQGC